MHSKGWYDWDCKSEILLFEAKPCHLRQECGLYENKRNPVLNSTKILLYLTPKIRELLSNDMNDAKTLDYLKSKTKIWKTLAPEEYVKVTETEWSLITGFGYE